MSVHNLLSGQMGHVLLSSIVQNVCMHMSFRSVDLHHCCLLIIKTYLSINPFINFISLFAWAPETKIVIYHILPFTILTVHLSSKQKQHKETTVNSYNTIFPSESQNLPFRASHATTTQWVSMNSWLVGMSRFLSTVVPIYLRNMTDVVQELQLNFTNPST